MSDWYNEDGAKNEGGQFTGLHKVKIKEAEKVVTDSGNESIVLRVAFHNRLDGEGKMKEITLDKIQLTDKNGKRPDADRISAMFLLLKANPKKTKKYKVERYNFDTKEKEMTAVNMYEDLIGKSLFMFIQMKKVFPLKKINPENNQTVGATEEGIWIPNYDKEKKVKFVFLRAFDIGTMKTWSELSGNKPAKVHNELVERYSDTDEKELEYDELLKLIKKRAEDAGLNFSGKAFESRADVEVEDDIPSDMDTERTSDNEDVPF